MRHVLTVPDIAMFYQVVIRLICELADEARSVAELGDMVQLEVVGENVRDHVLVISDVGENIFPAR